MINVAIIGAGIGREHLQGYRALPDAYDVRVICDLDAERAHEIAGDIAVTSDFDGILADPTIDLVDICLPPHLHFDMSMKALAAGKHVVCEKPLVSSLREADALAVQAAKYSRTLTPVFQYRFGPATAKLQALIKAGFAGKPLTAALETHWHRDAAYYANPWRGTWKGEQGGAVLGHAIHNHDLLCTVFGPISELSAYTATRVNDIEVEDCAAISFVHENGALSTSSVTLGAATDTTRLRFCFDRLTAESGTSPYKPSEGAWTFTARGDASQSDLDAFLATLPDAPAGFTGFFAALADALQNGGTDAVTVDDGRRSIELVSAIYQSSREGRRVSLPLTSDDTYYDGWLPGE